MQLGGLAHMVERPLSMREAPGSIPGSSILFINLMESDRKEIKVMTKSDSEEAIF